MPHGAGFTLSEFKSYVRMKTRPFNDDSHTPGAAWDSDDLIDTPNGNRILRQMAGEACEEETDEALDFADHGFACVA